jgi:hypothetical protein
MSGPEAKSSWAWRVSSLNCEPCRLETKPSRNSKLLRTKSCPSCPSAHHREPAAGRQGEERCCRGLSPCPSTVAGTHSPTRSLLPGSQIGLRPLSSDPWRRSPTLLGQLLEARTNQGPPSKDGETEAKRGRSVADSSLQHLGCPVCPPPWLSTSLAFLPKAVREKHTPSKPWLLPTTSLPVTVSFPLINNRN